ncbi:cell division protein SepF [Methanopyrus sp.]
MLGFLKKIFGEGESSKNPVLEDFLEEEEEERPEQSKVTIVVSRVQEPSDLEELMNELYQGNVLILDVKPLLDRDGHEDVIQELKRTAVSLGGFVGVIKDTVLLVTSDSVDIERRG